MRKDSSLFYFNFFVNILFLTNKLTRRKLKSNSLHDVKQEGKNENRKVKPGRRKFRKTYLVP